LGFGAEQVLTDCLVAALLVILALADFTSSIFTILKTLAVILVEALGKPAFALYTDRTVGKQAGTIGVVIAGWTHAHAFALAGVAIGAGGAVLVGTTLVCTATGVGKQIAGLSEGTLLIGITLAA